jgi:hypothetical protein
MTDLTLRVTKGSPLTNEEVDANFSSLKDNKLENGNNLSDIEDAAEARTNLDVYSKDDTVSQAIAMAIALG